MVFTFKTISELAPGSVDGFTVESLNWSTLRILPNKDQTIYSLAEKIINCCKKNPDLMSIEIKMGGLLYCVGNCAKQEPKELAKKLMETLKNYNNFQKDEIKKRLDKVPN